MDFERLSGDLKELRRRNRTLGAAVGLLAAGHVLALAVVLNLGAIGHFGPANFWPVEGAVKYWHFVDLMWVIIYPTLYLF